MLAEARSEALEYFRDLDRLERERRQRFKDFVDTNRNLTSLERSERWLRWILSEEPIEFGDQEAVVYLASRGKECSADIQRINEKWLYHEQHRIKECSEGSLSSTVKLDGRTRSIENVRRVGGMSLAKARRVEERSEFELRNFWGGTRYQEQTIDATMLRTVEWCGIGGFEAWWRRLARRTSGDFIEGGIDPGSVVYWLFGMSRSELAIKLMPGALKLALDNIELVRTGSHPWTQWNPDARRPGRPNEYIYEEFEDIAHASAVLFANYRLRASSERNEELLNAAAGVVQKYQRKDGSWPYFSNDRESSIEATAMAIHALAMHKPVGWERNARGAAEIFEGSQEEGGYWVDNSCPDQVYLTVLVLDAFELARGGRCVTFRQLFETLEPIQFAKPSKKGKPGRKARIPSEFIVYAGTLWRENTSDTSNSVPDHLLRKIAVALDEAGHLPPAAYLEGKYAEEIKRFNSRNSNSVIGPVQTWTQLVSHGDKDHVRGMRRLLSRCAGRLDDDLPM